MYVTDSLIAHVSYKQTWDLWLESVEKSEDDFLLSSMEAETKEGRLYFAKMYIALTDDEYAQFLPDTDRT